MNLPFIFAAQPDVPESFNDDVMSAKEQAFMAELGIESSDCTDTKCDGEVDDCE